jgi:predicted O-methyltransferase YrrM
VIWNLIDLVRATVLRLSHPQLAVAFAIPSHLTVQERIALSRLAASKRQVLEIGSYVGASACCFGAAQLDAGFGRIYCIDTWTNDAMSEGARDTYAEFIENTSPFSRFILPLRGFSIDMFDQVRSLTDHLELLFIDGDHSYEGVKSDWEAYKHLLRPGSIVVFHDWGWAEGVRRVVTEDVSPWVTNSGDLPNMWWGTIKACPC